MYRQFHQVSLRSFKYKTAMLGISPSRCLTVRSKPGGWFGGGGVRLFSNVVKIIFLQNKYRRQNHLRGASLEKACPKNHKSWKIRNYTLCKWYGPSPPKWPTSSLLWSNASQLRLLPTSVWVAESKGCSSRQWGHFMLLLEFGACRCVYIEIWARL